MNNWIFWLYFWKIFSIFNFIFLLDNDFHWNFHKLYHIFYCKMIFKYILLWVCRLNMYNLFDLNYFLHFYDPFNLHNFFDFFVLYLWNNFLDFYILDFRDNDFFFNIFCNRYNFFYFYENFLWFDDNPVHYHLFIDIDYFLHLNYPLDFDYLIHINNLFNFSVDVDELLFFVIFRCNILVFWGDFFWQVVNHKDFLEFVLKNFVFFLLNLS